MKKLRRSLALLLAVLLLVPSFVFPATGDGYDFTMSMTANGTDFNVGETISADIYIAAASEKTINSYQFTLSYDTDKLTLGTVTNNVTVEGSSVVDANNNGTYAYVIEGSDGLVISAPVKVATVTFTVKDGIGACSPTTIALENCYIGQKNDKNDPDVGTDDARATVTLHKHVIKLYGDNGGLVNDGADVTLYAKYNEAGLYSDTTFKTKVETVSVAAKEGFALASPQWFDGKESYDNFDAVKNTIFTDSKSIYLKTVQLSKVTVNSGTVTGGTVTGGSFYVMPNSSISYETLSGKGISATAYPGYSLTGWKVGDQTLTANSSVTVSGNVTVTPIFTAGSYDFTAPSTVTVTGGVTDGKVTHDKNVTFTVQPGENKAISSVSWIDQNGQSNPLTADANGVYTITGDKILGDVSIEVETLEYRTVTFQAGEGAKLQTTTLYTKYNAGGLFSDPTCIQPANVPVPSAAPGYRLPDDNANEPMWGSYTSASIKEAKITENITLTVKGIQQITVSFAAGANGALSGETTRTVDINTSFASIAPTADPNPGYKFDGWTPAVDKITEAKTFTANFSKASFNVSASQSNLYSVSITTGEGITADPNGGYSVVYGTNVSFTVSGIGGAKVTGVQYKVGSGETKSLTAVDGVYTIHGNEIIDSVVISASVDNTGNITFNAGDHGTGTVVKPFANGYVLTAEDIPTPMAKPGYKFTGWNVDPVGKTVQGDAEYIAQYTDASYGVTIDNAPKADATHGTDYKIPAYSDGKVISSVAVTVGGSSVSTTLDANGNYVIAGKDITGAIAVTTVSYDVTIKFVSRDQYKAIKTGEKMAVLVTAKRGDSHYQLSDGIGFYWSAKYNAYVRFVADTMTEAQLAARLTVADKAAEEIVYDGDISLNGNVNVVDAGIINDTLNGNVDSEQITAMMRFKMDVFNADATDAQVTLNGQNVQVTTADIQAVVDAAVGKITLN